MRQRGVGALEKCQQQSVCMEDVGPLPLPRDACIFGNQPGNWAPERGEWGDIIADWTRGGPFQF